MTKRIQSLLFVFTLAAAMAGPTWVQADAYERIGAWPFGPTHCIEVDPARDLAFLGSGGVVLILDVSDPTAPVLVTDELRTQGVAYDAFFVAATQHLYVACGEAGLEIWDVSVPTAPARISVTEVLYIGVETPVGNVDVWDHYAIVECEWGYVHCLDIADPANPVETAFNGFMGNPARDLYIDPDGSIHTSGADVYQRLRVLPGGQLDGTGSKDFILGPGAVYGNSEVVYTGYAGHLYIIDILLPTWPFWSITNVGVIIDMVVQDGMLYMINGDGLRIWNVQTHNSPFFVGALPYDLYHPDRIVLSGKLAYITDGRSGLHIVDVGDPAAPVELGSYETMSVAWTTTLLGDYALDCHDSDGIQVIDISNPAQPEIAGALDTPGDTRELSLQGSIAYIADQTGGLRIADFSSPTAPVELGVYGAVDAWRVVAEGDLAYVIDGIVNQPDELLILDVSDPGNITPVGGMSLPSITWDIDKRGDYLYIASHNDGVRIIDVSDPAFPSQGGLLILPSVTEIEIHGNLMHIACHDSPGGGYFIYDISDPTHPVQVDHYDEPGFAAFHVSVSGDFASLSRRSGLRLFDISDPSNITYVGEYVMPGNLFGITTRGNLVFVSDGTAGLQIVARGGTTAVTPSGEAGAAAFTTLSVYPNPFNPHTTLAFGTERTGRVRLDIFDLTGRRVRTLIDAARSAGVHQLEWGGRDDAGRDLPSGLYVARLTTPAETSTGKLVLLR
jgi:hypothetical protein